MVRVEVWKEHRYPGTHTLMMYKRATLRVALLLFVALFTVSPWNYGIQFRVGVLAGALKNGLIVHQATIPVYSLPRVADNGRWRSEQDLRAFRKSALDLFEYIVNRVTISRATAVIEMFAPKHDIWVEFRKAFRFAGSIDGCELIGCKESDSIQSWPPAGLSFEQILPNLLQPVGK
jgi:hypothetical protein